MTQDLEEIYAPPDWWLEVRWAFQMALDLEMKVETCSAFLFQRLNFRYLLVVIHRSAKLPLSSGRTKISI